ncbi:MAG: NUDIX domain-containing protein [Candidatus Aminicenantes bacterium]|nr:NUDIX domain-containing protein [Candidatus Aminicenantes bacterium]
MESVVSTSSIRPVVVVNAIVINSSAEVLLTRRRDNGLWCLPGGYLEFGETLADAVRREVFEETGVCVEVSACTGLYSEPNLSIIPPAKVPVVIIAFISVPIAGTPCPSDEASEVRYFQLDQLPEMIRTHPARINDAIKFTGAACIA